MPRCTHITPNKATQESPHENDSWIHDILTAKSAGRRLCGKEMCRAFFIQKATLFIRGANVQKKYRIPTIGSQSFTQPASGKETRQAIVAPERRRILAGKESNS